MPTSKSIVAEIVSKRTLNSKHYLLSDGSYQAVIHMGQIHFDDGEENLHNINTDLFDEADLDTFAGPVNKHGKSAFENTKNLARDKKKSGTMNRDNFDYQGLQVPFEAKIPRNFKRGYTIGKGTDKLTFKPVGASPAKGYVEADATNRIHYQDAWNDADVELELTDRGIKETITLKTDRAPSSFSFEVNGDLEDDLTSGELQLQPAWLEDAAGTRKDVTQTVRTDSTTGKKYVDMVANVAGLVYPIEIDPTVTIQPDGTTGKDTFTRSDNVSNVYGTSNYAYFGYDPNWPVIYRALLQFDISSIPSNSIISSADIQIYVKSSTNATPFDFELGLATFNWTESDTAITLWNNQNGDYSNAPTVSIGTTGTFYSVGIGNYVSKWLSGITNNGVIIRAINESNSNYETISTSEETTIANRPKLTVTYNQPPTAPTITSPNGGESWNSQETITWTASVDPDVEKTYGAGNGSTMIQSGSWQKNAQTFMIDSPFSLESVKFNSGSPVGTTIDVQLWETDGTKPTTLLKSVNYTLSTSTNGWYECPITYSGLLANHLYAIAFSYISNTFAIGLDGNNGYSKGSQWYYYQSVWSQQASSDLVIDININKMTSLQYQIQLSADDGGTWKDIVALSIPGATSYPYDFINETQSSTCLIRARAYDGTSYGPWDQSDGVFTIVHNQAPTAPTNLSPSGGTSKDRAQTIRYTWQHNDPNSNDPQSKFDFQWRLKGTTTWNTISQVTPNQYHDMPGGTLPRGDIEWQVRTYDQAGLSGPYSKLQTFLAGDKPATPTITSPADGATVAVANPTVQWSSSGQTGYTLSVKDSGGTGVYNATGTTNKAHTVQYDLANQSNYSIDVTISNTDNLSSDPDNAGIMVSYTPPADPILSTQIDGDRGSIEIMIDNPVPSGTEPNVSYNDIYRRKQGDSDFIRIAVNIPNDGSFTDYTPASDQIYEYYVRVYGDNGTFTDSAIVSDSVTISNAQIALTTDYTQVAYVVLNNQSGGPQRDFKHSIDRASMQFAGRESPVAEFSEFDDWSAGLSFIVQTKADIDMLRTLAYSRQTLLYRDSRGRREFVTIDGLDESDLPFRSEWYSVSVNPTRTSFSEKV